MDEQASPTQANPIAIRQYHPSVIAIYAFLYLPVGLSLYGLNFYRRGHRLTGVLLAAVALLIYAMLLTVGRVGHHVQGSGILGVLIALGLLGVEARPYRQAIQRGAILARWWPPLLAMIAAILVAVFVATAGAVMVG